MKSKFKFSIDICSGRNLEGAWNELDERSDSSVFLSWPWISSWIDSLPTNVQIKQITITSGKSIVGLGLFSDSKVVRHGFVHSRVLALNEYVQSNLDMMVEYNGLLFDSRLSSDEKKEVLGYLVSHVAGWDEIQLSGVASSSFLFDNALHKNLNINCYIEKESYARWSNLDLIREQGQDFISQLRRKARYNLRKYLAEYEGFGELKVTEARDIETASLYFSELKALHQQYWVKKGERGSFGNPDWEEFHKNLIVKALSDGMLQLVKVTAGDHVIGYVYSLVKGRHVYMIQCGYNYDEIRKLHPGYVSLYLIINYNLSAGYKIFDFMAGENEVKKSFSNEGVKLLWIVLQKKRLRFLFEKVARQIRRKVLGLSSDVTF